MTDGPIEALALSVGVNLEGVQRFLSGLEVVPQALDEVAQEINSAAATMGNPALFEGHGREIGERLQRGLAEALTLRRAGFTINASDIIDFAGVQGLAENARRQLEAALETSLNNLEISPTLRAGAFGGEAFREVTNFAKAINGLESGANQAAQALDRLMRARVQIASREIRQYVEPDPSRPGQVRPTRRAEPIFAAANVEPNDLNITRRGTGFNQRDIGRQLDERLIAQEQRNQDLFTNRATALAQRGQEGPRIDDAAYERLAQSTRDLAGVQERQTRTAADAAQATERLTRSVEAFNAALAANPVGRGSALGAGGRQAVQEADNERLRERSRPTRDEDGYYSYPDFTDDERQLFAGNERRGQRRALDREAALQEAGQDPDQSNLEAAREALARSMRRQAAQLDEESDQILVNRRLTNQMLQAERARRDGSGEVPTAEGISVRVDEEERTRAQREEIRRASEERRDQEARARASREQIASYVQDRNNPLAARILTSARGESGSIRQEFGKGFFGGVNTDLSQQLGQAARFSVLYGGLYTALSAFSQGMRAVVQDVGDFENGLTALQLATNRTRDDLMGLAVSTGNSATRAGFSQSQGAAVAAQNIGLYDLNGRPREEQDRIGSETTQNALNFARVAGIDPTRSTQLLAALGGAFEKGPDQQSQLLDQLIQIQQDTGQQAEALADAAANVGTLATAGGFDLPEVLALIARVAPQAGSPGAASGALRQVFAQADNPELQRNIESKYGIQAVGRDLRDIFADAATKLRPDQLVPFASEFGKGGSSSAVLTYLRDFQRIQNNAANARGADGTFQKAFSDVMANIGNRVREFAQQLLNLGTALAESGIFHSLGAILEVLTQMARAATSLVQAFNTIPEPLRAGGFAMLEFYAIASLFGTRLPRIVQGLRGAIDTVLPNAIRTPVRGLRNSVDIATRGAAGGLAGEVAEEATERVGRRRRPETGGGGSGGGVVGAIATEAAAEGLFATINKLFRRRSPSAVISQDLVDLDAGDDARRAAVRRNVAEPVQRAFDFANRPLGEIRDDLRARRLARGVAVEGAEELGEAAARRGLLARAGTGLVGLGGRASTALGLSAIGGPIGLAVGAAVAASLAGVFTYRGDRNATIAQTDEARNTFRTATTAEQLRTGVDQARKAEEAARQEQDFTWRSSDSFSLGLGTLYANTFGGAGERRRQAREMAEAGSARAQVVEQAEKAYQASNSQARFGDFRNVENLNGALQDLQRQGYNASERVRMLNGAFADLVNAATAGGRALVRRGQGTQFAQDIGAGVTDVTGDIAGRVEDRVNSRPKFIDLSGKPGALRDAAEALRGINAPQVQQNIDTDIQNYLRSTGRDPANQNVVITGDDASRFQAIAEQRVNEAIGPEAEKNLRELAPQEYKALVDSYKVAIANKFKNFGGGTIDAEQIVNSLNLTNQEAKTAGAELAERTGDPLAGMVEEINARRAATATARAGLSRVTDPEQRRIAELNIRNEEVDTATQERARRRLEIQTQGAQDLARISPGNTRARIESQRATAQREMSTLNSATLEYAQMAQQVADYDQQLRQNLLDYYAAFDLNQVGQGDTYGQAVAGQQDAYRRLSDAFQNGDASAQQQARQAANAADDRVIQEALARRQASRGRNVDPDDAIGQANTRLANLQDEQQVARQRNDFKRLDEIAGEIVKARRDAIFAQIDAATQEASARLDPRDRAGDIQVRLNDARTRLANTPRANRAGRAQIQQEINQLLQDQRQLAIDTANSVIGANEGTSDSGVTRARGALQQARNTLAGTLRGTPEYYSALADVRRLQQELAQAENANAATIRRLGIDISDPVANARASLQDAIDARNTARSAQAKREAELNVRQQQVGLEGAEFNQRLTDVRNAESLGRISHQEYLNYLQAERNRLNARLQGMQQTDAGYRQIQDEITQLDLAMKESADALSGATGQFNIGEIDVPTVYEVRRAIAERGGRDNGQSGGTTNNSTVTINGADFARVVQYINGILGQPATVTRTLQNRKG